MYEISFRICPYEVEGGLWKPKAVVRVNIGDSVRMIEIFSARDVAFASREAAAKHSDFLARTFIETKL